jgi:hypothetical protein
MNRGFTVFHYGGWICFDSEGAGMGTYSVGLIKKDVPDPWVLKQGRRRFCTPKWATNVSGRHHQEVNCKTWHVTMYEGMKGR